MRIRYVGVEGGLVRLTLDEFLQFSANVRAILVCEGLANFFDHRGRQIRTQDALIELAHTWDDDSDIEELMTTRRPRPSSAEEKANRERRRFERHSMVVPLSIITADGAEVGFTENISEGGVLFRSPHAFEAGDKLKVSIPVAGVADAVVVRSRTSEVGCFTAVAFVDKIGLAA